MAKKLVIQYAVFHNVGGTSDIAIYYDGGGADPILSIPFTEAAYLIDILRNEKPVYYDVALKRLSTSFENVGDGE
jgi:hypothetical protein